MERWEFSWTKLVEVVQHIHYYVLTIFYVNLLHSILNISQPTINNAVAKLDGKQEYAVICSYKCLQKKFRRFKFNEPTNLIIQTRKSQFRLSCISYLQLDNHDKHNYSWVNEKYCGIDYNSQVVQHHSPARQSFYK